MSYTDIVIMLPVAAKTELNVPGGSIPQDMACYLDKIEEVSFYECDRRVAESVERFWLGEFWLADMTDTYEEVERWLPVDLVLVYQRSTGLGIAQIFIENFQHNPTQIGDMVSSENLFFFAGGKGKNPPSLEEEVEKIQVSRFLSERFGLVKNGTSRVMYTLSLEDKNMEDLVYLLAGESNVSQNIEYRLQNSELEAAADQNIAMYDFYELYVSGRSLVYMLKDMKDSFAGNLPEEVLMIYICEIAVLQNAALCRINRQITDELLCDSNISSKTSLAMQMEFGKTILLWDNNIYKYDVPQRLSAHIVKSFGTGELYEEYTKNSRHLEQIAMLKNNIASEREGAVLNGLALILSIGQLVQLISAAVAYARKLPVSANYTIAGCLGLLATVIFLLLLRRKMNRGILFCKKSK